MTIHGLALCAGAGGLELGVRTALGGRYRVVCHVERDAYAAAALVARMDSKALDPAPIWDDLTTFDGVRWCGKVDLLTAGLPCQPYSTAGKRQGNGDERALWPHFIRLVREIEPSAILLENVPPFLKHFEPAWRELCQLGFEVAPPLRASALSVGAPHRRRRVFIFAAHAERIELRDESRWVCGAEGSARTPELEHVGQTAPDSDGDGREGERGGWVLDRKRATLRHDTHGRGARDSAVGPHWQAESPVLRVDDGFPERVDQLRVIGNAVMPHVAEAAFRTLLKFSGIGADKEKHE